MDEAGRFSKVTLDALESEGFTKVTMHADRTLGCGCSSPASPRNVRRARCVAVVRFV